jgi:hypothetical protein
VLNLVYKYANNNDESAVEASASSTQWDTLKEISLLKRTADVLKERSRV